MTESEVLEVVARAQSGAGARFSGLDLLRSFYSRAKQRNLYLDAMEGYESRSDGLVPDHSLFFTPRATEIGAGTAGDIERRHREAEDFFDQCETEAAATSSSYVFILWLADGNTLDH